MHRQMPEALTSVPSRIILMASSAIEVGRRVVRRLVLRGVSVLVLVAVPISEMPALQHDGSIRGHPLKKHQP